MEVLVGGEREEKITGADLWDLLDNLEGRQRASLGEQKNGVD